MSNGFVCSLHFSQENIETVDGKIYLKRGAVPTEFWIDINYEFEDEYECDDAQEMDADLQVKYNELQKLNLENKLDFNVREAALQKKNQDLTQTVQLQEQEISSLKIALASSQKLIEQMKNELVQAKALTKMTVSIYSICFFSSILIASREDRNMFLFIIVDTIFCFVTAGIFDITFSETILFFPM